MEIETFLGAAKEYCEQYKDCDGCLWQHETYCPKGLRYDLESMVEAIKKKRPDLVEKYSQKPRKLFDLNHLHPVLPHLLKNTNKIDYDTQILHIIGECQECQEALERYRNDPTQKKYYHFKEEMGDIAICALTLLVNSTTDEEFRAIAKYINAKNEYRLYGRARTDGGLINDER